MIDYLTLLDNEPIEIPGVCHIKNLTVREIRQKWDLYNISLHLLMVDEATLFESTNPEFSFQDSATKYEVIINHPDLRKAFEETLSFFICEDIRYKLDLNGWEVNSKDGTYGIINQGNFETVIQTIAVVNCLEVGNESPKKFRNRKAKEIYERAQKEKKKFRLGSQDPLISIGDIVSSLCANSNSYNLFNVFDLTIYQLYDQFKRLNIKIQTDVHARKWASWGSKPFDFSAYYQEMNVQNQ